MEKLEDSFKDQEISHRTLTEVQMAPTQFNYTRQPTVKKSKPKITFQRILDDILDKKKWQEKWKKIKDFVKKKKIKGGLQSERDDVFNALLALYAGEDEEEIFGELNQLYERYPEEVEFYIPQLCTYLFHFNSYEPRGSSIHPSSHQNKDNLERFLLDKAKTSIKFAHLIFWYIIAGLDDSESIQLSQHKHPNIWLFLNLLIETAESTRINQVDEEFKVHENLLRNTITVPKTQPSADTGSSMIRYDYTQFNHQIDNFSFINRYDQQIIRTLSSNLSEHQIFFSTPKFIADLIHISDALKPVEHAQRNKTLKDLLNQLNNNLPANVYVPITHDNIISSKFQRKNKKVYQSSHKVLSISSDYAFCLHSKERVPYHIIIEVALDELEQQFIESDAHQEEESFSNSEILASAKKKRPQQKKPKTSGKGQFIEMQIFNDISSQIKENTHIFSDEESKPHTSLQTDESINTRKAKSLETERSNVNKKYKLDNQKIGKEFSQDFLEEYKSVPQPKVSTSQRRLSRKVYESDVQEGRPSYSDNNLDDSRYKSQEEDDDEFLFYNNQKQTLVSKLCSCFVNNNAQVLLSEEEGIKPCGMFGFKTYQQVCEELKAKSQHQFIKNKTYISLIVKSGDDLRQEQFASQLISKFKDIFESHKLKLWLKPFNIIATCNDGGLIQAIPDAISIDNIRKKFPKYPDLKSYFIATYRSNGTSSNRKKRFYDARNAFIQSMAGYSLLCYILQIKDRHNGNILLDSKGHVIHVDFGFLLSNSPGNMNFEAVTFKCTREHIELMGGRMSKSFQRFKKLMVKGFMCLRDHAEEIISFVEMTMISGLDLPCFQGSDRVLDELRERFKLEMNQAECKQFINRMINQSTGSWRTYWYDKYQRYTVGIR